MKDPSPKKWSNKDENWRVSIFFALFCFYMSVKYGAFGMPGAQSRSVSCKAFALPTVLFLQPELIHSVKIAVFYAF